MSTSRSVPVVLGILTLVASGAVFVVDAGPHLFPIGAHNLLAAIPLALIAVAYLTHQVSRRPDAPELMKAVLLAAAFLFWAANQFWSDLPQAVLFNDIAIALFVLDVFLVIVGWPASDVALERQIQP